MNEHKIKLKLYNYKEATKEELDKNYLKCDECNYYVHENDYNWVGDRQVCENCLNENYFLCDDCDEYKPKDESYSVREYDHICERCRDNYTICYDCNELVHNDDIIYSERQDEYFCDSCYEDNDNIDAYHCGGGRELKATTQYRIGFEVEREDDIKYEIASFDVYEQTGWVVENDSSLNGDIGFEAVSPILPLDIDVLNEEFEKPLISQIIHSDFSSNCGGHITISDTKRTSTQLIDDTFGYYPILFALYPDRTENDFCMPSHKDNYKGIDRFNKIARDGKFRKFINYKTGGHYAIANRLEGYATWNVNKKGVGVEFRIFDAPTGKDDLLYRSRILLFMLQHTAKTIDDAMYYLTDNTEFRGLIKDYLEFRGADTLEFMDNVVKFALRFNQQPVEPSKEIQAKQKFN